MTENSRIVIQAFILFTIFRFTLTVHASGEAERQLAFPGAEGWGAHAKGGRGRITLYVTRLDDSAPGTMPAKGALRAAYIEKGPS
jgi:hypothetical protein